MAAKLGRFRTCLPVVGLLVVLMVTPLAPGTALAATVPPVLQRAASMVTTDPMPTAQIDGVVYAQVVVDGVVYAGGSFTKARPAGAAPDATSAVTRTNLMAYDLATGEVTSFAPEVNGEVRALAVSASKKTLYVGGTFTEAGSQVRNRFAAFSIPSGALLPRTPAFNNSVNALTVSGDTLYAGGAFSTVAGNARGRLAAIRLSRMRVTTWAPTADATVQALALTPGNTGLVVGGSFANLNSTAASGMGLLSPVDGSTKTWKINTLVKNGTQKSAVLSLAVDGDTVYGTGFTYGGGNFEGVFAASPTDGSVKWLQDCHGDVYGAVPVGGVVYSVGHAHFCSNIGGFPETNPKSYYRALAVTKAVGGTVAKNTQLGSSYGNFEGQPAPALYNWFPLLKDGTYTGQSQAAWSITAADGYLLLGGEFLAVNGVSQQGLVRLRLPPDGQRRQGPVLSGSDITPSASATGAGALDVSWPGDYDRDDLVLTYELLRDGAVVYSTTSRAPFWLRGTMHAPDSNLEVGRVYTYTVRVHDGDGNQVLSAPLSVAGPAGP